MLQILSPTAQFYRVMKNKIRRSPRTAEESKVQENHARSFFVQHSSKGYLAPSTLPNLRAICKTCETSHLQNIRSTSHLQKRMRNRSQFFLETVQPSETRLQWQPLSKKNMTYSRMYPQKKSTRQRPEISETTHRQKTWPFWNSRFFSQSETNHHPQTPIITLAGLPRVPLEGCFAR